MMGFNKSTNACFSASVGTLPTGPMVIPAALNCAYDSGTPTRNPYAAKTYLTAVLICPRENAMGIYPIVRKPASMASSNES